MALADFHGQKAVARERRRVPPPPGGVPLDAAPDIRPYAVGFSMRSVPVLPLRLPER
ncbi:hypothetical protein [Streptomyces eurythermus]